MGDNKDIFFFSSDIDDYDRFWAIMADKLIFELNVLYISILNSKKDFFLVYTEDIQSQF